MFRRSFLRALPTIPLVTLFYFYYTRMYLEGPLIVPPKLIGFFEVTEIPLVVLMIPLFAFVLPNKYEIELALSCGMSMVKLFFSKVIPILIYTVIPAIAFIFIYRYVPYSGKERPVIGIFIPENYRMYMIVSLLVTVLFCFLRVLMRNCYAPILVVLAIHLFATSTYKQIQGGTKIARSIIDPFISVYFLGDTVPGNIAAQYPELGVLSHAWTYNRLIFIGISIVLLALTCIMLHREKLHRGFGD